MSVGAVAALLVAVSLVSALVGARLAFEIAFRLTRDPAAISNFVLDKAGCVIKRAERLEVGSTAEEVIEFDVPSLSKFQLIFRGIA